MSSFIPVLLLAMLALAAGAAATYYYLKVRSLELKLEGALEHCSSSLERLHKHYMELAEQMAQKDVMSKEEADRMMLGIKEIMDSANTLKSDRGKKSH